MSASPDRLDSRREIRIERSIRYRGRVRTADRWNPELVAALAIGSTLILVAVIATQLDSINTPNLPVVKPTPTLGLDESDVRHRSLVRQALIQSNRYELGE